jgi:hypothetical protein
MLWYIIILFLAKKIAFHAHSGRQIQISELVVVLFLGAAQSTTKTFSSLGETLRSTAL